MIREAEGHRPEIPDRGSFKVTFVIRDVSRSQIMLVLVYPAKDLRLHSESNGNPLEDSKQGKMALYFLMSSPVEGELLKPKSSRRKRLRMGNCCYSPCEW